MLFILLAVWLLKLLQLKETTKNPGVSTGLKWHLFLTYSYHHILPMVWCIYAYNPCLISTAWAQLIWHKHMISICHCLRARKTYSISCCLWGGWDHLFIHRTESEAWFIVAVFFPCQKIRRDNLATVTAHSSRQWNTRDSCVTPLWRKHKGRALGQYRLSMVITVTQPLSPAGQHRWPRVWDEKRHEKQTNIHIYNVYTQVGHVTYCCCH